MSRLSGRMPTFGELYYLETIGPEKWAENAQNRRYIALLNCGPADRTVLRERIKELREVYERAKRDPQILKPMGLSLVELEAGLIKNIQWLKAGGQDYQAQAAAKEADVKEYAVFAGDRSRLHYASARSQRGRSSRRR